MNYWQTADPYSKFSKQRIEKQNKIRHVLVDTLKRSDMTKRAIPEKRIVAALLGNGHIGLIEEKIPALKPGTALVEVHSSATVL
jgi:hypothetical protein